MSAAIRARVPAWLPAGVCLTLAAALVALLHAPTPPRAAGVLPAAVLFDLTVTVPLVWWALAVRGRGASLRSLAFVVAGCLLVSRVAVGERTALTRAWLLAAGSALEIAILVRVALAVRAGRRADAPDLVGHIDAAAANLLGPGVAAHAVADELTFLAYALLGPWRRPVEGPARFSHHREIGAGSMTLGIALVVLVEMGAVHAWLVHAHPRLAWLFTLSSAWAVMWLFGQYQAMRLRRTTVEADALELRVGLRARARIPLANIADVRTGRFARGRGAMDATVKPAEPSVLLELSEPVRVRGFYGWSCTTTRILLAPDDRARFVAELEAARSEHAVAQG